MNPAYLEYLEQLARRDADAATLALACLAAAAMLTLARGLGRVYENIVTVTLALAWLTFLLIALMEALQ